MTHSYVYVALENGLIPLAKVDRVHRYHGEDTVESNGNLDTCKNGTFTKSICVLTVAGDQVYLKGYDDNVVNDQMYLRGLDGRKAQSEDTVSDLFEGIDEVLIEDNDGNCVVHINKDGIDCHYGHRVRMRVRDDKKHSTD